MKIKSKLRQTFMALGILLGSSIFRGPSFKTQKNNNSQTRINPDKYKDIFNDINMDGGANAIYQKVNPDEGKYNFNSINPEYDLGGGEFDFNHSRNSDYIYKVHEEKSPYEDLFEKMESSTGEDYRYYKERQNEREYKTIEIDQDTLFAELSSEGSYIIDWEKTARECIGHSIDISKLRNITPNKNNKLLEIK